MSYTEQQNHRQLIKALEGIEKQLKRIANAMEAEKLGLNLYRPKSYRDVLRGIDPDSVADHYKGGAKGCPGDYFRGARRSNECGYPGSCSCTDCWGAEYKEEEIIPDYD